MKSGEISIGKGRTILKTIFRRVKRIPSWEDRIRDRLSRDSSASVRSPPGLPTGLSSAACGVWCVVFFRALLLRLFLFLLFCALCVRRGISRLSRVLHHLSFLSLVSETDCGGGVYSSLVFSFLRTGETIAEIGKEALKTIDWSTQTPTQ